MTAFVNRKNKITLSDYNYRKDIENRLLMSTLTTFEVDLLREILNGSLKTSIRQLSQHLECLESAVATALAKLNPLKLFQLQGETILVDKEVRKYLETQIIKFDDDFEPNMEYLQHLFNKVPIHVLPNWYALSRTADNIFQAVIEKFLLTPKTYERYLSELVFDDQLLNSILKDLLKESNFTILARDLMQKYRLTREQFEECALQFEYNLVGFLSYIKEGDQWEEALTPFQEWRDYQSHIKNSVPQSIKNIKEIERTHVKDFGFLIDLNKHLESFMKKPGQPVKSKKLDPLTEKLIQLHLIELRADAIYPAPCAAEWLEMNLTDQGLALYRHPTSKIESCHDKDLRAIEKSLKSVAYSGWILLEEFKKAFRHPIGTNEPITLKAKGRRWKYNLPQLTERDFALIEKVIFERLYETGMIATGTYKGQPCFCMTPFGVASIG